VNAVGLEARVRAMIPAAKQAWPELAFEDGEFYAYVRARLRIDETSSAEAIETELAGLHLADLYLAFACARGDAAAMRVLDARFLGALDGALSRIDSGATDEIKQRVRTKLLVGDDGEPGRIAGYTGHGELLRWLRVAATREALSLLRKHKREVPAEDAELADLISPAESQELALLKSEYRSEFKTAFQAALTSLEPRQRTILRYHLIDGLNIDAIGAVYGVHRATVARWIDRIRSDLLERTRERLMAQIQVNRAEFESIMRLIQSQLDVSMHRLLERE
jgi:RNA polymerase sigma-70 factor, ECF subfamily